MGLDGFAVFPAIAAYLYVQYKGIVIFGNLIGKENSMHSGNPLVIRLQTLHFPNG